MTINQKIIQSTMYMGLILGPVFCLNFYLSTINAVWVSVASLLLEVGIVVFVWKMAKSFRENELDGLMTYWQGFSYVFYMIFFAALICSLFRFVFVMAISPDFLKDTLEQSMQLIEGMGIEVTNELEVLMNEIMRPGSFVLQSLMSECFAGAFLALIMAAFLRKNKVEENNNSEEETED